MHACAARTHCILPTYAPQSCASQPTCHVLDGSSRVGTCSCMQQQTPLQSCSVTSAGRSVMPDASQMCTVSIRGGSRRNGGNDASSLNIFYDWNSLSTTPCVLISSGNSYCYNVGSYGYLVVGHGIANTDPFASFGSQRRLFQDIGKNTSAFMIGGDTTTNNNSDWHPRIAQPSLFMQRQQQPSLLNGLSDAMIDFPASSWVSLASPCSDLAQAYYSSSSSTSSPLSATAPAAAASTMAVSDRLALATCAYWRRIANETMHVLNLTALMTAEGGGDLILCSFQDFVAVVRQRGVIKQLLGAPSLLSVTVSQMRFVQPLKQLVSTLAEQYAALHFEKILKLHNASLFNWSAASLSESDAFSTLTAEERAAAKLVGDHYDRLQALLPFMHDLDAAAAVSIMDAVVDRLEKVEAEEEVSSSASSPAPADFLNASNTSDRRTGTTVDFGQRGSVAAKRVLLQQQPAATSLNPIQSYTALVAGTSGFAGSNTIRLSPDVADTWLEGPFGWPPTFAYGSVVDQPCAAANAAVDITVETTHVLAIYYTGDYQVGPINILAAVMQTG